MTCLVVVERVIGMVRQGSLRELSCACQEAPQLGSMFLVLALVESVRKLGLTV